MKTKIDKGIPIPGRMHLNDILALDIGSSFTFKESRHSSIRAAIAEIKKRHPSRKFKTRIDENCISLRRIWRVK